MAAAQQFTDVSAETIADALSYIDNTQRDTWWRMAMAIKSELGDAGFSIWDDWSQGADNYNSKDAKDTWKSVKPHGGVNIGSLIYQAQQLGFDIAKGSRKVLTSEEIEARKKQREADARASRAEEKRIHGEVAKIANLAWNAATPADGTHPYLVRKAVNAYGLRVGEFPIYGDSLEVFKRIPNTLLVPIHGADGKITSLQGYFDDPSADPDRRYMRDGKKRGGFHIIGNTNTATIVICEGYATGATIFDATGWCVIVAFDDSGLKPVAEMAREMFPHARLVIAADNDQWTTRPDGTAYNPGMEAARAAAGKVNALVIEPLFQDESTKPNDFNDLFALEGLEAVSNRMHAFDPKPMVPANDNTPAGDIDVYTPLVHINASGKPRATIENMQEICKRLGITIRYNVIKKEEEILIPRESFIVDNAAVGSLARLVSRCAEFDMPTTNMPGMVTYIADQNPHNPVTQWVTSKPWDGVSRVQALFDTLVPTQQIKLPDGRLLRDVLVMRWMISAVAAAFEPNGVSAHGVLVLQGDQYLGKTQWFKTLVPEHMDVLQDGMILKPDDRDSVKQILSYWMVELGELDATFRKSDIAALKAFITKKSDVLRKAYAAKESHFARRTVFFASVNPKSFLHDPTGNRRFWTIECKHINHGHGLDMQQVWAEIYDIWKSGEGYYLSPEEMAALNSHNEDFQVIEPIEERIQTRLQWDADSSLWEWRTATEVLLMVGMDRPTSGDATKAAQIIRKLNKNQAKRTAGKNMLLIPPRPLKREDYEQAF